MKKYSGILLSGTLLTCALGMDNQQTITDKNTPTETDDCMDDLKTNLID